MKAPLPIERYSQGFDLSDALKLYAVLLEQDAAVSSRRMRAAGELAGRNALLDQLIVTAQRKYFRRLPNSLLAAIAAALSGKAVPESVVRARAAALRK